MSAVPVRPRARWLAASLLAGAMALAGATATQSGAVAEPAPGTSAEAEPPRLPSNPTPEEILAQNPNLSDLGTPVTSRIITNMVLGEEDGVSMTYGVYRGQGDTESPATLVVAETLTGEIVRTIKLAETDHVTEIRRATDGRIYFVTGSDYTLWVYDPETTEATNLGHINPGSPSDGYGWTLAAAEDGRMYIGSYPEGLLYLYDPATGAIENLGQVDPTQKYIRALAYDLERGNLYVGVGGSRAQIYKIEPDGTKTALLSEEATPGAMDHSFVSTFTVTGGKLFARGGLSELLVIDVETDEVEYWKGDGKEAFGYQVTQRPDAPEKFIFTFRESFWEYDAATATTRSLGVPHNGYLNDGYWTQLDDPEWPGWTLVAATQQGVVKFNPERGISEGADIDYRNPILVQKLLDGPDSMYASGYMVGLAPLDTVTGEAGETVQAGQFESSAVREGKMLLGTYGHGRLLEYDPATGATPREVFTLQAENQDRPFGLDYDPVTDTAWMGTVPYYGHNQGALTRYDFASGEKTVWTDEIVTEQSVISVLHHDGLVYVGTTLDGGLGAEPSGQTEAHFIVVDPATGAKIHDFVPVPGDEGVTGLMVGPDDLIWGVSEDTVFKYDPATEEIVYSEALLGTRYGTSTVWAWAYLGIGSDGNVYGTNRSQLFRIDAETMEYTKLVNGVGNYLNIDAAGDVVFSSGVHVYKYDVPAADDGTEAAIEFTATAAAVCEDGVATPRVSVTNEDHRPISVRVRTDAGAATSGLIRPGATAEVGVATGAAEIADGTVRIEALPGNAAQGDGPAHAVQELDYAGVSCAG
ncbi:ligand-binding sensor domain-containing protein [Georgenia subflava]|uniref:PQQ-binding-like beta-propeller repeat protein n=1 Tax=Georgenia subflava TaxID=1622177 RepID=A0A6N7EIP9_9MICO|nr:hypothetical protein [Georgenia subflava]MPV36475.1 hypothetical protein [Georgenia subflava]